MINFAIKTNVKRLLFYARRFCLTLNDAKFCPCNSRWKKQLMFFLYIFIWWFRRGIQKSIGFALRRTTRRFGHERFVPEMTLCVTFGAPRLGTHFRMLLRCEKYAMICMVWRTLVPQTTLCVAFGARRRWVRLSLLRGRLASGQPRPTKNS